MQVTGGSEPGAQNPKLNRSITFALDRDALEPWNSRTELAMRSFISPLTILPAAGVAGLLLLGGYIFLGITAPVTEIPPHGNGPSPNIHTIPETAPLNLPL